MAYASKYISQIDNNYNAAAGYYKKRREIFTKLYNKNYQKGFEQANQVFFEDFRKAFEEYSKNVIDQFTSNKNTLNFSNVLPDLKINTQLIETGLTIKDFYGLDKASIKRKLGFVYEKMLDQYFNNRALNPTREAINSFTNGHTGEIIRKGFTFGNKGGAQIRADFTFGNVTEIPDNMEVSVELEQQLSNSSIVSDNEAINNLMLQNGYLDESKFIGGFSVKNYDNNIAYTHSNPLMKQVNEEIAKLGSNTSVEQATETMLYILSKHLIAISSPTVLGLYKAHSFEWMDDILIKNRYFFHLREYKGAGRRKRELVVKNSAIYLQSLSKNIFKYSVWRKKQGEKDKFNTTIKSTSRLY